jgi:hypothetical protein
VIWGSPSLYRLDTSTGTVTLVTTDAGNVSGQVPAMSDVAANGTVSYAVLTDLMTDSYTTHVWSAGVDTTLGPGYGTATDGTSVAAGQYSTNMPLYLWSSTGVQTDVATSYGFSYPYYSFALGNGRLAYNVEARTGPVSFSENLCVREADGTVSLLDTDAENTELVTSWGEIFYRILNIGRHRYGASGRELVNSGIGTLIEHDGTAFVLIGRAVFAVDAVPACPSGPCATTCGGSGWSHEVGDTGVPDAGVQDAGPVDAASLDNAACLPPRVVDAGLQDAGPADAGLQDAGGVNGATGAATGGCGSCNVRSGGSNIGLLALVLVVYMSRRLRRAMRRTSAMTL